VEMYPIKSKLSFVFVGDNYELKKTLSG